jgi:hypothetical protein
MKKLPNIIMKSGFSWISLLLIISFFVISVTIGMVIAESNKTPTDSWFMPIFAGAFAGFILTWFPCFAIAQFYLRVILGGPFCAGDKVKIIKGPHKGKTGTVMMADTQQGILEIDLGIQSDEWQDKYFDNFAVRRLRK